MKLIDNGTYDVEHEHINITILDVNFTNMSLVITEEKFGAIDTDHTSFQDYYIIIFLSSSYTLQ